MLEGYFVFSSIFTVPHLKMPEYKLEMDFECGEGIFHTFKSPNQKQFIKTDLKEIYEYKYSPTVLRKFLESFSKQKRRTITQCYQFSKKGACLINTDQGYFFLLMSNSIHVYTENYDDFSLDTKINTHPHCLLTRSKKIHRNFGKFLLENFNYDPS